MVKIGRHQRTLYTQMYLRFFVHIKRNLLNICWKKKVSEGTKKKKELSIAQDIIWKPRDLSCVISLINRTAGLILIKFDIAVPSKNLSTFQLHAVIFDI